MADTVRVIRCFADIIAMRHFKEGAPLVASQYAGIPVINAGDGGHQHPTQTLTDLVTISGQKVLVMKPVTFMNLSGEAVRPAADFYKIPPDHVLVISDDTALAPGRLRIRKGGSAGGHNGLKNIIQHLGTDQFPRIRVGVGQKPHPDYDLADWVLGKFVGEDKKTMDAAIKRAADAVECLLADGPDTAMNRFNG